MDLYREKDQLVVEASLPGAARGDLQIHVADNLLILHGTIPRENDIPEQDYLIRECRQGQGGSDQAGKQ